MERAQLLRPLLIRSRLRTCQAVISRHPLQKTSAQGITNPAVPFRNLGWLLGNYPEPGTDKYKRYNRNWNIVYAVSIAFVVLYKGIISFQVNDPDTGEFAPKVLYTSLDMIKSRREMKEEQEQLDQKKTEEKKQDFANTLPNFEFLKVPKN